MWTYLILAWLSLNVILVLLLWHRAQRLDREEAARMLPTVPDKAPPGKPSAVHAPQPRPARLADASGPRPAPETRTRVVVVRGEPASHGLEPQFPGLQHCRGPSGTSDPAGCRLREMQAEIRELRLAVAELSLDKARLSSAMARMRC